MDTKQISSKSKNSSDTEGVSISNSSQAATSPPKRRKSGSKKSSLISASEDPAYKPICEWSELPPEILSRILLHLPDDVQSINRATQVNFHWHEIGTSDLVWRELFFNTFFKTEPSDEHFLEYREPMPTLLKPRPIKDNKRQQILPSGNSPWLHLFAHKYPQFKRWTPKSENEYSVTPLKVKTDAERFTMLIPWRGFVVSASSNGQVAIWDPQLFSTVSSSSGSNGSLISSSSSSKKLKPWKTLDIHLSHIWWMVLAGDLCFTVCADGSFKVTNLEPLVQDRSCNVESVTVISGLPSVWCIDVNRKSRKVVIGCQEGSVILFKWKKGNWRNWSVVRTVKVRSGIWDVCLLPSKRFAVCCNANISVFHFEPTQLEQDIDKERPPVKHNAAEDCCGVNLRQTWTPYDEQIPRPDPSILSNMQKMSNDNNGHQSPSSSSSSSNNINNNTNEQPPAAPSSMVRKIGIIRNMNYVEGLLISAYSEGYVEAWNVDTGELVWSIYKKCFDIFDIAVVNNKVVCVGSDNAIGGTMIVVYDIITKKQLFSHFPEESLGRVFSTCVTDDAIFVCAVDYMYQINFKGKVTSAQKDEGCSIQ